MMFCLESFQLMGSCFCRDSIFICLLLPENMSICDKYLSKCGTQAKLNDLNFYYILRFFTFCVVQAERKM